MWVPELIAKDLGVRPGDTIVLSNASRSVEITVDGIYADLYLALPPDGYWLQWEHDVRAPDPDDVAPRNRSSPIATRPSPSPRRSSYAPPVLVAGAGSPIPTA